MLDFTNSTNTWHFQMVGRKDGAQAIQLGEGWIEHKIELFRDTPSIQKEHATFGEFIAKEVQKDFGSTSPAKGDADSDKEKPEFI